MFYQNETTNSITILPSFDFTYEFYSTEIFLFLFGGLSSMKLSLCYVFLLLLRHMRGREVKEIKMRKEKNNFSLNIWRDLL